MIAIRALQHYLYCPHRWGMLYLDGQWQDNAFTVKADGVHERVHSEKTLQSNAKKSAFGGVTVYSEKYGIYGKTDSLEFVKDGKGVFIKALGGRYTVNVIEYKPTMPKSPSTADRLQLYAQYACANEIFENHARAYLYYADVKKRLLQTFDEEDEKLLVKIVGEISKAEENNYFPPAEYGKKCSGCSLADVCMPKKPAQNARAMIMEGVL